MIMKWAAALVVLVVIVILGVAVVDAQVVLIQPGNGGGAANGFGACNFKDMTEKYNGCQKYLLGGKGADFQNECCVPMGQIARECLCGVFRPFANMALSQCKLDPCP